MNLLASISLFGIFYSYLGYFLILYCLRFLKISKFKSSRTQTKDIDTISIIIPVRNEQKVINKKIKDTLALQWKGKSVQSLLKEGKVELIITSDGSDDDTDNIVRKYLPFDVTLITSKERKGKGVAQEKAMNISKGDIIIFTDAKINLPLDALDKFEEHFKNPNIGLVSSVDKIEDTGGESLYIRYEMMLRELEASFYSLIGVSGSCFAARKEIAQNIATDVPNDFSLLLKGIEQGYKGEHAEDIIVTYQSVKTEKEEFDRKVRTVIGGISTFFAKTEFLNFKKYSIFSWMLLSHKLSRWLVPFWAIILLILTVVLALKSVFWLFILISISIFLFFTYLSWKDSNQDSHIIHKATLFLILTNVSIIVAWIKYFSGERAIIWDPSNKGT